MHLLRAVILSVSTLVFSMMLMCCCTDCGESRLVATVSIPPQQWLLEELGGERVHVNCLLKPGADPESQEPAMHQLAELQRSQIYFTLGALPLEEALIERTADNFPELLIVDTSIGIDPLKDECQEDVHGHSSGHGNFDPHIWTSPANCRIMAANMSKILDEKDPEAGDYYRNRLEELNKRLSLAEDSIRTMLEGCRNRSFMVWHPSLGYFARDFGLRQLSVQQEGKEVTAMQLAESISEADKMKPTVLFYDIAQQGNETSLLRSDIGLPTVPLRLMAQEFLHQLVEAAKAIRKNQRQ